MAARAQEDCSVSGEQWNDIGLFRRCLAEYGLDAWETNQSGRSVLHNAALQTENPAIVALLLDAGADPNIADNDGLTPLRLAAWNANPMVSSHLLRAGADPNIADNEGFTPLSVATAEDNLRLVQLLLDSGADPDVAQNQGWTPLHRAVDARAERTVRLLLDGGADPNTSNNSGYTPLHTAATQGALNVVRLLLDADADPNRSDNDGYTPLHWAAARSESVRVVSLLLNRGADPVAESNDGRTPLHSALRYRAEDGIVSVLAEAGPGQLTPLHLSALKGDSLGVSWLLVNGEDPNKADDYGWASLHFAIPLAGSGVVAALLAAGADPNQRTASGTTPLVIAATQSPSAVVTALLSAGAATDVRDPEFDWTPLHAAARGTDDPDVLLALLDAGADAAAKSGEGQYPVDIARTNDAITGTSVYSRLLVNVPTPLPSGRSASGALGPTDGVRWGRAYYDEWSFSAASGQTVVVTMESESVDSYLMVLGDDGTEIAADDDGGEGLNSRVSFRVQESGLYTFLATSAVPGQTGRYAISVRVER